MEYFLSVCTQTHTRTNGLCMCVCCKLRFMSMYFYMLTALLYIALVSKLAHALAHQAESIIGTQISCVCVFVCLKILGVLLAL